MGTEVVLTAILPEGRQNLLSQAEAAIKDFESRFSRFLSDNELASFNNSTGGVETPVSEMMAEMLNLTKRLHQETSGIFDPTIINSLESVGYNKSFTEIKPENEPATTPDLEHIKTIFASRPKLSALEIKDKKVVKPDGLRVDFGGIGKGFIIDYLSGHLFKEVSDFWISAGGDLLVKGSAQDRAGWRIGVQNPYQPDKEVFSLNTAGRTLGIATSGIFRRQGANGGFKWHHLIDPRSGLPVENDIMAVTAIAASAAEADVFAKTVLLLGAEKGLEFIEDRPGTACLIFFKGGGTVFSKQALNYF